MRLTERDRHLCGLLAQARWLTTEQVTRLSFPGRHERYVRKRLGALGAEDKGGGQALLVKHLWVTRDAVKHVWGLTAAGYREAEQLLDVDLVRPPRAFERETMRHHVALTDLFVSLLAAPLEQALARVPPQLSPAVRKKALGGLYARALHRGWRWTVVGDGVALPWRQSEGGRRHERLLRPDAVLELVEARRRLFIECEMGTNTIVPVHADTKPNATLSKLRRWEAYVSESADVYGQRTWYQQRYADGFAPEVVFLVHSERRQRNVAAAIDDWREKTSAQLHVRAVTLPVLLTELGAAPAPAAPPERDSGRFSTLRVGASPLVLSPTEAALVVAVVKAMKQDLRRRDAEAGARVERVAGFEAIKALAQRLHSAAGGDAQPEAAHG